MHVKTSCKLGEKNEKMHETNLLEPGICSRPGAYIFI